MKRVYLTFFAWAIIAGFLFSQYWLDEVPAYAQDSPGVKVERVKINIGTGSEGSAGGSASTETVITGRVVAVAVDYAAGITTTTDLTLAQANELVSTNIINLSNTATDAVIYPQVAMTDNAGTTLTYDGSYTVTDYYPVADILTLTITQTEVSTPVVTVDIYYEQ